MTVVILERKTLLLLVTKKKDAIGSFTLQITHLRLGICLYGQFYRMLINKLYRYEQLFFYSRAESRVQERGAGDYQKSNQS